MIKTFVNLWIGKWASRQAGRFVGYLVFLSLFVLSVLSLPRVTQAQEAVRIQQLRIQVMPEFDDPRVLVIVQGRLSGESSIFPREVTFFVPAGSQINQMATMNVATGQTAPQQYTTLPHPVDSRWTAVSYTLGNAHFFYEFYYNPLPTGSEKQFSYVFHSPLPVDDLQVEVQQPKTAENFTATPASMTRRVDNFGLTIHQFDLGALEAGKDAIIAITYQKNDPDPSVSREQVIAMQADPLSNPMTVNNPHTQTQTTQNVGAILMIVFGGVMVATVIGRYLWLRRPSPALVAAGVRQARFCSQCGSPLKPGAGFCHECGESVI